MQLFVENCSTCHGVTALGSARAPSLLGLGAATVSLWLSTGWMPLKVPTAEPEPKPPAFPPAQISQIVAYVTSLAPGGPPIPNVDLTNTNVATGFDLFALNCAACHTITGAGDALAGGLHAPSLHGVTATVIAEAIATGPGNMPVFSQDQLSPTQVNDIVAYIVKDIQHPASPGGLSLGGVGPVAEGFVGLFAGVGACVVIAFWVGDRTEDEDEGHEGEGHEGDQELAHA
jgi:ubiquinol-cytochrome c reductase cytochrome c subunit